MVVRVHVSSANLRAYVRITGIDKKNTLFAMREIRAIWETNVSRFFMKHEVSYPLHSQRGRKYVPIRDAFSCTVINGEIIGSIDTTASPHIKYLIYGVPPGEGAFIPVIGARKKTGHFWGVPTIYWKTWESFFKRELLILVTQYDVPVRRKRQIDIDAIRAAAVGKVRKQVRSMRGGLI